MTSPAPTRPSTPTSSSSAPARAASPPPSPPPTTACGSSSWSGPTCAAARRRGPAAGCGRRATRSPTPTACIEDVEQFRTYLRAALGEPTTTPPGSTRSSPLRRRWCGSSTSSTALTVRARRQDLRHLRRPARRRHRPPLGRARPGRRPHARRRRARMLRRQLYETSFLGMGDHGRAGPDGVPLGVAAATRAGCCTPPGGSPGTSTTWSPAAAGMQLVNGTALVGRLLRVGARPRRRRAGRARRSPSCCATGRPRHRRRRGDPGRPAADHRDPRRRAGGGRVPARRRPPPGAVPAHPDRRRALVTGPGDRRRRGHDAGRVGRRPAAHRRGVARRLVPRVARARTARGRVRACSRTSWTAPSPAASACSPPGAGSSTRPTATTTTSPR